MCLFANFYFQAQPSRFYMHIRALHFLSRLWSNFQLLIALNSHGIQSVQLERSSNAPVCRPQQTASACTNFCVMIWEVDALVLSCLPQEYTMFGGFKMQANPDMSNLSSHQEQHYCEALSLCLVFQDPEGWCAFVLIEPATTTMTICTAPAFESHTLSHHQ